MHWFQKEQHLESKILEQRLADCQFVIQNKIYMEAELEELQISTPGAKKQKPYQK